MDQEIVLVSRPICPFRERASVVNVKGDSINESNESNSTFAIP